MPPRYSKILKFVYRVHSIDKYLEHFSPFGTSQVLPDDKLVKLADPALPLKWQRQLLSQVFYSSSKSLNKLVDLCELLDMSGEILHKKGEGSHPTKQYKQSGARHKSSSLYKSKGSN